MALLLRVWSARASFVRKKGWVVMPRKFVALVATIGIGLTTGALVTQPALGRVRVASAAPTSATDQTRIPHYFGPYSNWANSPQVLSDGIVTISGGGGTGAEATATVSPKTGGITMVT